MSRQQLIPGMRNSVARDYLNSQQAAKPAQRGLQSKVAASKVQVNNRKVVAPKQVAKPVQRAQVGVRSAAPQSKFAAKPVQKVQPKLVAKPNAFQQSKFAAKPVNKAQVGVRSVAPQSKFAAKPVQKIQPKLVAKPGVVQSRVTARPVLSRAVPPQQVRAGGCTSCAARKKAVAVPFPR